MYSIDLNFLYISFKSTRNLDLYCTFPGQGNFTFPVISMDAFPYVCHLLYHACSYIYCWLVMLMYLARCSYSANSLHADITFCTTHLNTLDIISHWPTSYILLDTHMPHHLYNCTDPSCYLWYSSKAMLQKFKVHSLLLAFLLVALTVHNAQL